VVRAVAYGEADAVVTFFTEAAGKVAAVARGCRSARRRYPGVLEPMHTLRLVLRERAGAELASVERVAIEVARTRLVTDLDAMTAAGTALRWVRVGCPPRVPEPAIWSDLVGLLDALEAGGGGLSPAERLAGVGLRLLGHLGYGLDLETCVGCGRAGEPGRAAHADPVRGGLVCRACGGGPLVLSPALRHALVAAQAGGAEGTEGGVALVEQAIAAHVRPGG
jgi:DNA repair protein RecO (recombination protein O)